MGQGIVFLVLVTPKLTIPVGFAFHIPDPEYSKWYKENKKLLPPVMTVPTHDDKIGPPSGR